MLLVSKIKKALKLLHFCLESCLGLQKGVDLVLDLWCLAGWYTAYNTQKEAITS